MRDLILLLILTTSAADAAANVVSYGAEQVLNRMDSSCHSVRSRGSILSYALARKEHHLR